jgi:hypothetical protein
MSLAPQTPDARDAPRAAGARLEVSVECYSGYRAEERPLRFTLGGRHYEVVHVDDQWYSPHARYFRVLAEDGNLYVLQHDERQDAWTLHAFRAAR